LLTPNTIPDKYLPANNPNSGLLLNYCRNPDGEVANDLRDTIWCYKSTGSGWEYCNPIEIGLEKYKQVHSNKKCDWGSNDTGMRSNDKKTID
jgi:hypothetical protein